MRSCVSVTELDDRLRIEFEADAALELPHLWLRDNCACENCRVAQTEEKQFILSSVPIDIRPKEIQLQQHELCLIWPDGHQSDYPIAQLRTYAKSRAPDYQLWPDDFLPARVGWSEFQDDDETARNAYRQFLSCGALVLTAAPQETGLLEALAMRFGPMREMAFDRIHDVKVDPNGYNIAHTALALPPHNDFASYEYQPSVQALHMLENKASGGATVITDGLAIAEDLREYSPEAFDVLQQVSVGHRQFDASTETFAIAPLLRLDERGRFASLRFSNQLTQTLNPEHPRIQAFYQAYHALCEKVLDERYSREFRLHGGEILVVAANRVLHSRRAIESKGARHLQDAYFDLDNVINKYYSLCQHQEISP